jgi:outer membrane protein insertion porin family
MRRLLITTAVFLLTVSGFAQTQDLAGQKIERVEVTGNASVAQDTIRVYLGLTPGEDYDPAAVQRNFLNLWQTGLFDDIKINAVKGESGVIVTVSVKERPRIGAVEYRGNKNLNLTKIGEALDREKIDLHVGNTIEQTLVKRAAETIHNAYSEGGFEGVSVEIEYEDMPDPAEKRIVFQINEGIKAKIAEIDFVGNQRFSDRRLRRAMKEVKEHNLITWVRKKNVYVPSKLEEDLQNVKNIYLDAGYKDVEFGDPQIIPKGNRVTIKIPVKEGVVHTFGEVTVAGNTVFNEKQIIGDWPLTKGETLSRRPIANRIELFEELYRRSGYIYAFINPEYEEVDGNVVNVRIQVFEGDQFRLGRLEFQGNTVTKDKVLRRELFLDEGDIMDMETFKASMYKLGQLGYFKITDNPDFKVNQDSKTVDITVKGQEEGKNDVQFGGGYSEAYGFFAQFQFATRNFLGEGENLGVSFQRGRRQNFFSLSYADPWFMDRPHSLGVSIFDRETTLPASIGYDSRGKGGSVAYGYRIDRFESVTFLYGLEDRTEHSEFVAEPDMEGNIPLPNISDEEFTTSAFVPQYRYDSRDNPFDTTRGRKFTAALSYSGGPLGGTINLFKPVLNFTQFRRISRKSSVSFNAEAGQIWLHQEDNCVKKFAELNFSDTIEQNNNICVPRSERFLVGGEQSIRGFEFGTLGPRETIAGFERAVGGHKYSVFNLEYVYRVNDPLRFVLWSDAGNAYADEDDWDLSQLRYTAGAELRIFLPVFQFPLRFIYAVNLDPRDGDDFKGFQFSIGNTF